jgi:hypothetical protein
MAGHRFDRRGDGSPGSLIGKEPERLPALSPEESCRQPGERLGLHQVKTLLDLDFLRLGLCPIRAQTSDPARRRSRPTVIANFGSE